MAGKIVVTGGRHYNDWGMVQDVLNALAPVQIYVGDAGGADELTLEYAKMHKICSETFFASWKTEGDAAGPLRNARMLKAAGPEAIVVAFPGGRGTENCIKLAKHLNMVILRVEP